MMPTPITVADPSRLAGRVREMISYGRVQAARPILAALRKVAAADNELDELEGLLLLREGRVRDALDELDAAIARSPAFVGLRICRADARMQANDIAGAAADAAEAVILSPRNAQAKALLGVILIEMKQPTDAVACLVEAVAAEPLRVAYRQGLAEAQERAGDIAGAQATLTVAIGLAPSSIPLRLGAIMLAMRQRNFAAAAALADAARQAGAVDACVFGLLGHALSSLGRHHEALDAYTAALKLAPEDPYVRHLVRAGGVLSDAERAPSEYLEVVFDGYAERFESHLIGLGYRIPGLVRAALLQHLDLATAAADRTTIGPVLDLGCGTGLSGVVLSDLPIGPLTGVDISAGMLQQARSKQLYAALHQSDLDAFLSAAEPDWALIIAADVLIYFGALERTFSLVHSALRPDGLFLLSLEQLDGESHPGASVECDWKLGRQARYAHSEDYVRRIASAAGFKVRELRHETLRYEGRAPVPGLFIVLERTGNAR